ncbi:alpha/beta fold hydrolase [Streptomyces sp. NPDC087440]|uniref:alpha/beta fold hydrolase n=1 Tax=Streptomyces sp. NPDC087440 TaxID=3365790 RepID=UPI00380057EF
MSTSSGPEGTPLGDHPTPPPAQYTPLAAGNRVAYRTWGAPTAPPVVLLHGRTTNSTDWTDIAEALSATRRVYAPDIRGHGLSDWPGGYHYPQLVADIAEFIDALGLERVDLVGHSMGGAIALQVAQSRPEKITRIVLEDALPPFPLVPARATDPRPPQEEIDALDYDWDLIPATDEGANHPHPEWEAGLSKIAAPVLVVSGGEASFLSDAEQQKLTDLLPDARRVTIPVGHLIHRNDPDGFLAELRAFGIY